MAIQAKDQAKDGGNTQVPTMLLSMVAFLISCFLIA